MSYDNPTYPEAVRWVNQDFKQRYGKTLDDMVISSVRGYWRDKNFCLGSCGCQHPKPFHHTYYFSQPGRGKGGRFLKPYRAWSVIRKHQMENHE